MPSSNLSFTGSSQTTGLVRSSLTINLDAIAANYRLLRDRAAPATCAAVVKADAYGLGAVNVASRLWREGCRIFFVASLEEAITLREVLPAAEITALNGLLPGEATYYRAHEILPTLNDSGQIDTWAQFCRSHEPMPAAVHLDTGMSRLGLAPADQNRLAENPERLNDFDFRYLLSHLACADTPEHPMNEQQRMDFAAIANRLPAATRSLAASSGIFLGPEWHFDMVRAGISMYGGAPNAAVPNPVAPVVTLNAIVLQIRDVDRPETVGYGATHQFTGKSKVATIAAGYADGYLRSASGQATAYSGETVLPLVGRVSMDLITLDATKAEGLSVGDTVQLIGPQYGINELSADAGTIPYEILTSLGHRYHRQYTGGDT
ncbi:MAG: alanine racemase [Pseudomonadota bacterium]|nr:alanine racemase [Pseudomonadota bacterium]